MAGGGTTVQTATSEPWKQQIPYLTKGMAGADELLAQGLPEYYQGKTLADFDPAETAAHKGTMGYWMGPRAARQQAAAEQSLVQGLSGQVDPNAYNPLAQALQQQVMGNLKGNILPGLRENLIRTGQEGGGSRNELVQNKAIANAVQSGMTKPLADMYTNAYNQAQNRALQSGQLYPSIMSAPMAGYDALAGVGGQRRGMSQNIIDQDMQRYNYEAMAPYNALNQYMNTIAGNYGGTTTQTTPKQGGGIGSILGAILPALI